MPGNPRYQPRDLQPYFGYDRLYKPAILVELAVMEALAVRRVIPESDMSLLTPAVVEHVYEITTTEVDRIEKTETPEFGKPTGHDVRALVKLIQSRLPAVLRRWVHVPLTSYDVLDTARSMQFSDAHEHVVRPKIRRVIQLLVEKVRRYSDVPQIGRTHGQHALPVTVGFWLATILYRLAYDFQEANGSADGLVGKISGAVGAYNAQFGLGIDSTGSFERDVLLNLRKHGVPFSPAPISTQIVPPEPLARYLFSILLCSGALAQLGRDARHLMRSEIGEVGEPFATGQVGSSTMAHKRNPINFENTEGMYLRSKSSFGKVLDTIVSDHQRDLVGSSLLRDFPEIVVNLVVQLDTLLRKDKHGEEFLRRLQVDPVALQRNLTAAGDVILAEPLYIALQMGGFEGDAHELVNHTIVAEARKRQIPMVDLVAEHAAHNDNLAGAWEKVPQDLKSLLRRPTEYVGRASQKALEIAEWATDVAK